MSETSAGPIDDALCRRVEDAGINASAPREQRWIDGWIVRYCAGKARRARCVQAVADGALPIDARLGRCLAVFREAGCVPHVRITPYSRPPGLDAHLATRGWEAIDETIVMVAGPGSSPSLGAADATPGLPAGHRLEPCESDRYAAWISAARGSSPREQQALASRLAASPVPFRAFVVRDDDGEAVAGGQFAREGDVAGLYDVMTLDRARGRGIASALGAHLMATARRAGATAIYLQVDAANDAAIRVYRRLGFVDAYRYHYRMLAGPADGI